MKVLPLAAALLVLLSGCAQDASDEESASPFVDAADPLPTGSDHDHRDPAQHHFAHNAELADVQSLQEFGASAEVLVGAHALARSGNLLAVAMNAAEGETGQQGFHLFDVTIPDVPLHLSYWDVGVPVSGDRTIAFSGDGKTVFLGFEGGDARPGVAAIDVSDPVAPQEAAFWADPQDFGSHTISAGVVDGTQYVFSLAVGVNILRYDAAGFTLVGKYVTADEPFLAEAVQSSTGAQTYALRALYGHDMTFYQDPGTGLPLLLVAYAYQGLKVLDLSVPSLPVLVARWQPPADGEHRHYVHSVQAERQEDGRLLVVVGSETFEDELQSIASPVWVLDATDAVASPPLTAEPVHLGTWRNPGLAPAGLLTLSVHFFRLQEGRLYLSHYHGGMWAIDLRTPEAQAEPREYAYILPVPESPAIPPEGCCIGFDLAGVPMVFDVEVGDGVVYGADMAQGLVTVRFGEPET